MYVDDDCWSLGINEKAISAFSFVPVAGHVQHTRTLYIGGFNINFFLNLLY